jgi:hypothetical protein
MEGTMVHAKMTKSEKVAEARRRWGSAEVLSTDAAARPEPAFGRGVSAAFAIGARIPRMTEQRRDIEAHRLER